MNHITQEQVMELVSKVKVSKYTNRHFPDKPAYTLYADALEQLCNAAIEWHIAQQAEVGATVPVALSRDDTEHGVYYYRANEVDALIKAAPKAVPLTDEQIDALWTGGFTVPQLVQRRIIARAIEATHGIGGKL